MAKVIDESIKKQLSKSMYFFLKYFPVRVRNVGEDGRVLKEEYMSGNKRLSLDSILRRQMTGSINFWGKKMS